MKIIRRIVCLSVLFSCAVMAETWNWKEPNDYCQFLDNPLQPLYQLSFSIMPNNEFEDFGKSTRLDLEGDWEFAYFRNVLWGDMDFDLSLKSIHFLDDAHLDLPSQLASVALDLGWAGRYQQGYAIQVRVAPGIYSDLKELDGDIFFFPFSGSVIKSFNHDVSGIAGLQIRPNFDRVLMPIIGVQWKISDMLRMEAGLPETRIVCFPDYAFGIHIGFDWNSTTYDLKDARDLITLEDFSAYAGATYKISDELQISGDVGRLFWRDVIFGEPDPVAEANSVHVSDQWFVRFALIGPF